MVFFEFKKENLHSDDEWRFLLLVISIKGTKSVGKNPLMMV
jgi:hypothetical protein